MGLFIQPRHSAVLVRMAKTACRSPSHVWRHSKIADAISNVRSSATEVRKYPVLLTIVLLIFDVLVYCASHNNWIRNIRFSIMNRPLSQ